MTDQVTQDLDTGKVDSLSGCKEITWSHSQTAALLEHRRDNPYAAPKVTHTAWFDVRPFSLPPIQIRYGKVKFWPEQMRLTWVNGKLVKIEMTGHQATKSGLGRDVRDRVFKEDDYEHISWDKVPELVRQTINMYELRVSVASPSPAVVE